MEISIPVIRCETIIILDVCVTFKSKGDSEELLNLNLKLNPSPGADFKNKFLSAVNNYSVK